LWLRSARPAQGKIVLWAVPAALILAGLVVPGTAVRVGLVLAGIGAFLALPAMMLGRLDALAKEVEAADRNKATELLRTLPEHAIVKLFAPLGWRSLQLAQLHLKVGDGHAAAAAFAETARLCLQPDAVMLVSAEAHAHVVAGERMKARDLLQKLADAKLLGPRDQLDLGIVLVLESKKFKQALSYIEAARKSIGDHPLVVVAHALALQKVERIDEASELLEKVQIAIKDEPVDPLTDDLLKRARKGAQDFLEGQVRRERRARSRRTTIVVSSEAAASVPFRRYRGQHRGAPHSVLTQRDERVNARGAPRRHRTGGEGHQCQHRQRHREGERVMRRHSANSALECVPHGERDHEPGGDSRSGQHGAAADHQLPDRSRAGA
jgi:tetratricopeptide (TPR) repeat protein